MLKQDIPGYNKTYLDDKILFFLSYLNLIARAVSKVKESVNWAILDLLPRLPT